MNLNIRKLSYQLGAEVSGVDITKPLADETFRDIHNAFLEYCILLFRGQSLTREQHIALSRRFGELDTNVRPRRDRHQEYPQEYPEISVTNPAPHAQPSEHAGDYWHSDRSNTCIPAMASLLRCVELPKVGGDTMFSNLYLAYETLSNGLKKLIEGLYCVHMGSRSRIDNPPLAHPLVRVHAETGRKSLYLTERIKQIVGMTVEESMPLVHFLCQHAARPQFVYRHQWRKDDVVIWDNRCTNHIALGDYDTTRIRHMERTTVMGTPCGYVYDGPMQ